jgi:4'-phosphopantetheinyl transferase
VAITHGDCPMQYRSVATGPDVVDIWLWPLDVDGKKLARLMTMLGDSELARAARFRHEHDRLRFVVGRGGLREIISSYLGIPPRRLDFAVNAFGKPRLSAPRPPLHFNLSHAGGMAVLAVSDRYQVGVDLEEIRPFKEDVAGRFFSASERHALRLVTAENYFEAFYRCWTRKEAFVKAHGAGLSFPLDAFDVSIDATGEPKLLRLDGDAVASAQWRLLDVALPPRFVGAMAALTANNDIFLRYRDYDAVECNSTEMSNARQVVRSVPTISRAGARR